MLQHPDGLGAMEGFNADINRCLSDRNETVTMSDKERKAGILGVQFFDNASHNAICHRLINFIHQPGYLRLSLDASHNALELDHSARSIARGAARSANRLIRELNSYIHAWSKKILLGSRNAALSGLAESVA